MNYPDHSAIISEVLGHTIVTPSALINLLCVCVMVENLPGNVAEFGVYKGGTLRLMARCLPEKYVFGFDTFTGMPAEDVGSLDRHQAGEFGDTSLREVQDYLADLDNVLLVQGRFPGTFARVPDTTGFCLAHLDCDQYSSYMNALSWILTRLVDGGIIVVDDYTYLEGARKAVDVHFPNITKPPYAIQKVGVGEYKTVFVR